MYLRKAEVDVLDAVTSTSAFINDKTERLGSEGGFLDEAARARRWLPFGTERVCQLVPAAVYSNTWVQLKSVWTKTLGRKTT